jgi:hypothetical protein
LLVKRALDIFLTDVEPYSDLMEVYSKWWLTEEASDGATAGEGLDDAEPHHCSRRSRG